MAWATVNRDGTAIAVAFVREQLAEADGMTLVELDDALVIAVMEGQRTLGSLFEQPPVKVSSSIAEQISAQDIIAWTRRYPAIMGSDDVDALCRVAGMIKPDAIAVEVGSRLGGSAKIILDHAPSIKRLYCFDTEWRQPINRGIREPWMDPMREHWQLDDYETCLQFAQHLLKDYPMVRLLPLYSPDDIGWWSETVDFIFEDSSHVNPQLRDNLDFWVPLVKSGGIIAGHDYSETWPDVVNEVNALSHRLGAALQVQDTVWWMIKP